MNLESRSGNWLLSLSVKIGGGGGGGGTLPNDK